MNMLRKLMYGRYGSDQLSFFLMAVFLVLYAISSLAHLSFLYWIGLALLFWNLYRILSRKTDRRRAENARFLELFGPVIRWAKMRRTIHRDKDHRYFKCPNCGQYLRVPKGKGTITVCCRNCGVSFQETS